MIVRTSTARATPEGADGYRQHCAAEVKLTDLTFWDSLAAIEAFAGPDLTAAVVDETAQRLLLDYDTLTSHSVVVVDAR